jgi:hypothetical protein
LKPADPAAAVDPKAAEQKPAEQKPAEPDAKAAELAAQVPEDGKYEFALPEGMKLDEDLAALASPILKETGFTRAEANKAAQAFAKVQEGMAAKLAADWVNTQKEWQGAAKADKEYGGEKFDQSLLSANQAVTKFGSPDLAKYLAESGAGNHPEVIRFMVKVGNAFSDDKPANTDAKGTVEKSPAQILYGKS